MVDEKTMSEWVAKLLAYDKANPEDAGTDIEEKMFLLSMITMVRPESILEIGVSAGHATTWIACAAHLLGAEMTSVDHWKATHGGKATGPEKAMKRLADCGLEKATKFVGMPSSEYFKTLSDDSIDLVWIDGDHSLEGATADIKEGLRVGRKLVLVHDTNQGAYTTVRKACVECCTRGCFFDSKRGIFGVTPLEEKER